MYVKINKAQQALSALGIVAVGVLPTGCAPGGGNSALPAQASLQPDCNPINQSKTRGKAALLRHSLGIHSSCVVSN